MHADPPRNGPHSSNRREEADHRSNHILHPSRHLVLWSGLLLHVQRINFKMTNQLIFEPLHSYVFIWNTRSETTTASFLLRSLVKLSVDVLLLFFRKISPFYFCILLVWTHIPEQHVPVPLFEVKSGMREIESTSIFVIFFFVPFLGVHLNYHLLVFLKFHRVEGQHISEENWVNNIFFLTVFFDLSSNVQLNSLICQKWWILPEVNDHFKLSGFR